MFHVTTHDNGQESYILIIMVLREVSNKVRRPTDVRFYRPNFLVIDRYTDINILTLQDTQTAWRERQLSVVVITDGVIEFGPER